MDETFGVTYINLLIGAKRYASGLVNAGYELPTARCDHYHLVGSRIDHRNRSFRSDSHANRVYERFIGKFILPGAVRGDLLDTTIPPVHNVDGIASTDRNVPWPAEHPSAVTRARLIQYVIRTPILHQRVGGR